MIDFVEFRKVRKIIVDRYWEIVRLTSHPYRDALSSKQISDLYKEEDDILEEYAEILPFLPISRCPICNGVLECVVDLFGIDGPWWAKGNIVDFPAPQSCEHFRLLLGAIDFGSVKEVPEASKHKIVYPGPGVPFVIPRIIELANMKAVISCFDLTGEYSCYPIAYFSEKPFHGAFLHQPWAREAYQVLDEQGNYKGWTISNDALDFDLRPWIEKGILFWIEPGDAIMDLKQQGKCPFEDLPGIRSPQLIERGEIIILPLPDGSPINPFETA
ncbi:hypothetical protein OR1_01678 [Geobacter sp. OR-1]|uniref:hypothetical protein n=1 Tax=Geobacter sp. OR-1 TaxID=1266765 RepID=UPI000544438E|nr:hypothetical protein [Geobacter sp. OR-1]GAM09400.1 hypothetical protein OR1_01678 [Geobacter sp. OR-1]